MNSVCVIMIVAGLWGAGPEINDSAARKRFIDRLVEVMESIESDDAEVNATKAAMIAHLTDEAGQSDPDVMTEHYNKWIDEEELSRRIWAEWIATAVYLKDSSDLSLLRDYLDKYGDASSTARQMALNGVGDSKLSDLFVDAVVHEVVQRTVEFYREGKATVRLPLGNLKAIKALPVTDRGRRLLLNYPFELAGAPLTHAVRSHPIDSERWGDPGNFLSVYYVEIIKGTDLETEFVTRAKYQGLERWLTLEPSEQTKAEDG